MDENLRWLLSTLGGFFAGVIGALMWVNREFKAIRDEIAMSRHHMRNEMHTHVGKLETKVDNQGSTIGRIQRLLARKQLDEGNGK